MAQSRSFVLSLSFKHTLCSPPGCGRNHQFTGKYMLRWVCPRKFRATAYIFTKTKSSLAGKKKPLKIQKLLPRFFIISWQFTSQ